MINYVTLRGANGYLRVTLAPYGRHSCDPRKLDVRFFFFLVIQAAGSTLYCGTGPPMLQRSFKHHALDKNIQTDPTTKMVFLLFAKEQPMNIL